MCVTWWQKFLCWLCGCFPGEQGKNQFRGAILEKKRCGIIDDPAPNPVFK